MSNRTESYAKAVTYTEYATTHINLNTDYPLAF